MGKLRARINFTDLEMQTDLQKDLIERQITTDKIWSPVYFAVQAFATNAALKREDFKELEKKINAIIGPDGKPLNEDFKSVFLMKAREKYDEQMKRGVSEIDDPLKYLDKPLYKKSGAYNR